MGVVRDVLRRHEFDLRYRAAAEQERIASLYFPLVLAVRNIPIYWPNFTFFDVMKCAK